jgi:F0F1-type ATP synthase assembly protein I
MNEKPQSARDLAEGVAVRAGVLGVAGAIVGLGIFALAAKIASGLVKGIIGALLLGIGAGVLTWKVKKAKRRFATRRAV